MGPVPAEPALLGLAHRRGRRPRSERAIALLLGLFGIGPTLLYVGAALVIAIVAGMVIGALRLERFVEPFVFETKLRGQVIDSTTRLSWDDRFQMGREEVVSILKRI